MIEYCVPLVKVGIYFIPMKANINEELKTSENAIKLLKIEVLEEQEFLLPIEISKRTLFKFEKKEKTSNKYPRKFSEIKKNSL